MKPIRIALTPTRNRPLNMLLGSLLMLVALVYLYFKSGGSFDILAWHKLPLPLQAQTLLFFAFCWSSQVLKSAGETACTLIGMTLWFMPQI